eukprot:scaffold1074_cov192-Pinguiococcus_pyrenoidosus.AAC.3
MHMYREGLAAERNRSAQAHGEDDGLPSGLERPRDSASPSRRYPEWVEQVDRHGAHLEDADEKKMESEDLLRWSAGLDFEAYISNWMALATSKPTGTQVLVESAS